ncbi:sulfate permease, partial [Granulosicoccus sp.]
MNASSYFPFLGWARSYNTGTLGNDLMASLIVTVMLIPQSLAYAMLAGLPPVVGLYASIGPLLAYAIFGSSRTLSVGPVAVVSLMTAAAVSQIATPGSAEYASIAMMLAFLSGMFLFVSGFLRLGFLANLLSHPVISGFITASGILIALSQLKHLLGTTAQGHSLPELLASLVQHMAEFNIFTLMLSLSVIGFLLFTRSYLKPLLEFIHLPSGLINAITKVGPAFAVIVSTLVVASMGLDEKGVNVVGDIPKGLPGLTFPEFDAELWQKLLPAALLISVIGFVESVSVGQTLAAKRRQRIDPDQELIGLGSANLASAFSGGFPVTGGFSRSVVNFDAGAQTPLAGAFTAIGIAVATLFLTPLFKFLPVATLAATIIVAVLTLIDLQAIRRTWNYSKSDFAAMLLTIIVTLGIGVEAGVITGVLTSLLLHLWRTSRPHIAIVGRVPGTEHFRNIHRHAVETNESVLSIRIDESLYFANARFLEDSIYRLVAENESFEQVVLLCSAINEIDGSAVESLEAINQHLSESNVTLHLSEVKGPVMDRLKRSHFLELLSGQVFLSQHEAMLHL